MKKRYLTLAVALLLCVTVCLTGCSLVLTTPSFDVDPTLDGGIGLPIYNPDALPYGESNGEQSGENGSQGNTDNTAEISETRPYYDLGTNKTLSGKIVVLMVFVDDNTSSWTYREVLSFVEDQAKPALLYLANEAAEWGIELEFELGVLSTVTSGTEIKYEGAVGTGLEGSTMSKDVLEHTAEDLGFATPDDMVSAHRERYSNAEIAYINVFNMAGRSYTCMQIANPSVEYAEHCVLFADTYEGDPRLEETRSATVAHEFLHLYGAEDFYAPDKRAAVAAESYPDDIMLIAATSLSDISFSDVTAHMIGWYDTAPEICFKKDWKNAQ